jgi:hypothetical protein
MSFHEQADPLALKKMKQSYNSKEETVPHHHDHGHKHEDKHEHLHVGHEVHHVKTPKVQDKAMAKISGKEGALDLAASKEF